MIGEQVETLKLDVAELHRILTKYCVSDDVAMWLGWEMDANRKKMSGLLPGTDRVVEIQAWQFKLAAFNNAIVAYNAWRRERAERGAQAQKKIIQ